jgi:hypothetical protein
LPTHKNFLFFLFIQSYDPKISNGHKENKHTQQVNHFLCFLRCLLIPWPMISPITKKEMLQGRKKVRSWILKKGRTYWFSSTTDWLRLLAPLCTLHSSFQDKRNDKQKEGGAGLHPESILPWHVCVVPFFPLSCRWGMQQDVISEENSRQTRIEKVTRLQDLLKARR